MCKLSLNVVPNVYNSLQWSFLSLTWPWSGRSTPQGKAVGVMGPWKGALAWPWWGRSLPKGNQWECWDPGLGPNMVRLPVHLSLANAPLTPLHPLMLPKPPDNPSCPLHPASGSVVTLYQGQMWLTSKSTCHPQMPPDTPYTPCQQPDSLHCLMPPHAPCTPCQWECCDPILGPMWSASHSTPMAPTPLMPPDTLLMPYTP